MALLLGEAAAQQPLGCANWPAAAKYCGQPISGFEHGIAYPHARTISGLKTTSEHECCCACAADPSCNGWTLYEPRSCSLKQDAGPAYAVPRKTGISGLMPPRPPPPPYHPLYPTPVAAKNVLFLAVDDMRPSLGAYNFTIPGHPTHSPNIDKLASEGTVFTHAYVQYAYCSPSRNSCKPDSRQLYITLTV